MARDVTRRQNAVPAAREACWHLRWAQRRSARSPLARWRSVWLRSPVWRIKRAQFKSLEVDELTVRKLRVVEPPETLPSPTYLEWRGGDFQGVEAAGCSVVQLTLKRFASATWIVRTARHVASSRVSSASKRLLAVGGVASGATGIERGHGAVKGIGNDSERRALRVGRLDSSLKLRQRSAHRRFAFNLQAGTALVALDGAGPFNRARCLSSSDCSKACSRGRTMSSAP